MAQFQIDLIRLICTHNCRSLCAACLKQYPCWGVKAIHPLIRGGHPEGHQYFYTGKCGIKMAPETQNISALLPLDFLSPTLLFLSQPSFLTLVSSLFFLSSSYFYALCVTFFIVLSHLQDPGLSLLSLWIYEVVLFKRSVGSACSPEFELHSFTSFVS